MKDSTKAIIAIICLIIVALFINNFFSKIHHKITRAFIQENTEYVNMDKDLITDEYEFTENQINDINISLINEKVEMQNWDGNTIKVVLTSNLNNNEKPIINMNNSELFIESRLHRNFDWKYRYCSITIQIPQNLLRNNSTLVIEDNSVSGKISITGIMCSKMKLATVSGSIDIEDCSGKTITIKSISGSSSVENSDFTEFNSTNTSGTISYTGKCKQASLTSISGSIHFATNTPLQDDSSFKSTSGSIHISLPENDGFTHYFSSTSGSIYNDFTDSKTKGTGHNKYKSGNVSLETETISGSIRISKN